MPQAVPGRNEIVPAGKLPLTDVGEVKGDLRVPGPGHAQHPGRNVYAFDGKPVFEQKVDDAARPAADVEGALPPFEKGERPGVLSKAVLAQRLGVPKVRDLIVTFGDVRRLHQG